MAPQVENHYIRMLGLLSSCLPEGKETCSNLVLVFFDFTSFPKDGSENNTQQQYSQDILFIRDLWYQFYSENW